MSIEGFLWVWRCRCGRQQLYKPTEALASWSILAKVLLVHITLFGRVPGCSSAPTLRIQQLTMGYCIR